MAIKVQVKGDQKFDNSFADSTCCNGTYINDAYGVNPYTTPTLDGTFGAPFMGSQVPASLVSLYGNNGFQPAFTGFKPIVGNYATQGPSASSVTPFAGQALTGLNGYGVNPFTYGVNPFMATSVNPFTATSVNPFTATTVNAFGQVVPAIKPGFNTPVAGTMPFQGWTTPATPELLSANASSLNGFAAQNPTLASPYGMTPAWSSIKPATFGGSSVSPFAFQAQQYAAASNLPWMKAQQEAAWGINPMTGAWTGSIAPTGMIDPSTTLTGASTTSTPWANGLAMNPMMSPVAQQSTMTTFVPVDIYENEDEYILLADMPGASIEDVDILVEGQSLLIKGLIKPMNLDKVGMGLNTVTLLQEKPAIKNIERIFPLGSNVLTEKLTAKLIDGILTIKLPKVKVGYGSTHRVAVATA